MLKKTAGRLAASRDDAPAVSQRPKGVQHHPIRRLPKVALEFFLLLLPVLRTSQIAEDFAVKLANYSGLLVKSQSRSQDLRVMLPHY